MKKLIAALFLVFAMSAALSPVSADVVSAQSPPTQQSSDPCHKGGILNFPRWYDNICVDGQIQSPSSLDNGDAGSGLGKFIWIIVLNVISMLLYLVGYISLAFIIWGGFKYIISGDNASGTVAARKTILNAVIGLIISIMSVGLVNFITGAVK